MIVTLNNETSEGRIELFFYSKYALSKKVTLVNITLNCSTAPVSNEAAHEERILDEGAVTPSPCREPHHSIDRETGGDLQESKQASF